MDVLITTLLAGFLNRVRGGASAWLAEKTKTPVAIWRYGSFIGFGTLLALIAGIPFGWAVLFGLGMWQLGARLGGWSGLFAGRLGLDVEPERWMVGPLRDAILASAVRGFVWGLGGAIPLWLASFLPTAAPSWEAALLVPAALAVGFVVAPPIARRIGPADKWFVDNGFIASRWGWMELFVGVISAAVLHVMA